MWAAAESQREQLPEIPSQKISLHTPRGSGGAEDLAEGERTFTLRQTQECLVDLCITASMQHARPHARLHLQAIRLAPLNPKGQIPISRWKFCVDERGCSTNLVVVDILTRTTQLPCLRDISSFQLSVVFATGVCGQNALEPPWEEM